MTRRGITLLLIAAAPALGACHGGGAAPPPAVAVPTLQYRTNSTNAPGFVSPCAGGQPQMQYNCPENER